MLIAIPERTGKSRTYDLGAFGFPWLAIANIIIGAANAGWSYYVTKQQIEMAKSVSGVSIASAGDIDAIVDEVMKRLPTGTPKSEVTKYVADLVQGAPDKIQQISPGAFFEQQVRALAQRQPTRPTMPTWGWILIGIMGIIILKPDILKGVTT